MDYGTLEERIARFITQPGDEDAFSALALSVFAFQFEKNEPYQNFCRGSGIDAAAAVAAWQDIPCVPTAAFKIESLPLVSFKSDDTKATFLTSGTTGETRGSHYFRSLDLYEQSIRAGWAALGLPAHPLTVLVPHPQEAPHSSLSHMMGTLCDEPAAFVFGDVEAFSHRTGEPQIVCGTALSLLRLCETGCPQLAEGSCLLETGGYKGVDVSLTKEAFYSQLTEAFGVPSERIINEYSMTELSSQFYSRGVAGPHSGPPWTRTRIVHPATGSEVAPGETGHLEIFDLANLGSVIAIRTQDLATRLADGQFSLVGRDPDAIPRGCSRAADELLGAR